MSTNATMPAVQTPAPALSPEETARRARVVAREQARKAHEAARIASDERRKATIQALSAKLGKGAKLKAKNASETFTPEQVLAALEAAREEGGEIRVSVSVPATEERDGRRFSLRLEASD